MDAPERPVPPRRMSDDDRPDPAQMEVFRRMSPAERIRLAFRLREDAIRLRRAALRAEHPGATDAQLDARIREWCTNGDR
jgi:hypothetical protein